MARKPTAKYWQKRAIALKKRLVNQSIEQYEWMAEQYEKAAKNIQREIEHWYARFAENNEISLADARRLLTSRELKELKWDVEEYIEKGRTLNYSEQWAKELENASARAHINRYEALQLQMQQQAEVLYGGQLDKSDEALREVYTQGYYRTAYDFQKGFGIGSNLAALDERRIEKVLARHWGIDDKNFSDRIWENKRKLIGTLDKTLTQSIIRGETPDKAIKEIARVMEVDKKKAGRLVMTESAFIASESQKDCYKELGVGYFEVLATLDSHTCSDCGVREGEKIPMSEYKSGITAPPFHPYCRCCTVPAFDDEFDVGERAARGADGKTYYVPGDMSYEEWKEKFVILDEQNHIGNDIIKIKSSINEARENVSEFFKNYTKIHSIQSYGEARSVLHQYSRFDALPQVVDEEQFLKVSDGKQVLYRGLMPTDEMDVATMKRQFVEGVLFDGTGSYGNGTYTTPHLNYAKRYSKMDNDIMELLLFDDAKIIKYSQLVEAANSYRERAKYADEEVVEILEYIFGSKDIPPEYGSLAEALGYDAIQVDIANVDHVLILNRGKVIVKGK